MAEMEISKIQLLVENAVASFLFQQYPQTFVGEGSRGEVDIVGFKENRYDYFEVIPLRIQNAKGICLTEL